MPSLSDKITNFNETVFRDVRHKALFERWQRNDITYEEYQGRKKDLVNEQASEFWQAELFPQK